MADRILVLDDGRIEASRHARGAAGAGRPLRGAVRAAGGGVSVGVSPLPLAGEVARRAGEGSVVGELLRVPSPQPSPASGRGGLAGTAANHSDGQKKNGPDRGRSIRNIRDPRSGHEQRPHLLHRVRLDLADALGGNAVLVGQLLQRRLVAVPEPAARDDVARAVIELDQATVQRVEARFLFRLRFDGSRTDRPTGRSGTPRVRASRRRRHRPARRTRRRGR